MTHYRPQYEIRWRCPVSPEPSITAAKLYLLLYLHLIDVLLSCACTDVAKLTNRASVLYIVFIILFCK
jgi:hypothetical protein